MLTVDDAAGDAMRYRALETMRQYGRDRLGDTADPDVWRRRHAEHYALFAERAGAGLLGPDELLWRPRVIAELDNLRAAVAWALDSEQRAARALGARIVAGLSGEANSVSSSDVAAWAERALRFLDEFAVVERAGVLKAAAWSAQLAGDLEHARARAEDVLHLDVVGYSRTAAFVQLAYLAVIEGDYDRVMATLGDALEDVNSRSELSDASLSKAAVLIAIAGMQVVGGVEFEAVRVVAADAVRAAHESRHPTSIANALFASGLATWRSDPDRARPELDEAIALVRAGTSTVVFPLMLAVRALVATQHGDAESARADVLEAIAAARDKGDVPALVTVLEYGIEVWIRFGEPELAATVGGATTGPLRAFSSLPLDDVSHRDEALAEARAALGDATYDAAAARGAAMSVDELVALALS
jgi:hypothetical protein